MGKISKHERRQPKRFLFTDDVVARIQMTPELIEDERDQRKGVASATTAEGAVEKTDYYLDEQLGGFLRLLVTPTGKKFGTRNDVDPGRITPQVIGDFPQVTCHQARTLAYAVVYYSVASDDPNPLVQRLLRWARPFYEQRQYQTKGFVSRPTCPYPEVTWLLLWPGHLPETNVLQPEPGDEFEVVLQKLREAVKVRGLTRV